MRLRNARVFVYTIQCFLFSKLVVSDYSMNTFQKPVLYVLFLSFHQRKCVVIIIEVPVTYD
jgi:hypothetical protein